MSNNVGIDFTESGTPLGRKPGGTTQKGTPRNCRLEVLKNKKP
ncbi:MAG: hypothetical protein WA220_06955 [Candidatus Nitrosopolaris sp.]